LCEPKCASVMDEVVVDEAAHCSQPAFGTYNNAWPCGEYKYRVVSKSGYTFELQQKPGLSL
jgi:hypothetical protein